MQVHISKQQARHFLLGQQLLLAPKSLPATSGVETVFTTLRVVQYDPLNPCGRNTDLVLQARIKGYHPNSYYDWLYTKRKGIECDDKELCIVPIEDYPLLTHHYARTLAHPRRKGFLKKHRLKLDALLSRIANDGPLSSLEIDDKTRVIGDWTENSTFSRAALDILWKAGKLSVAKRVNGKKYYGLPQTIYEQSLSINASPSETIAEAHILRRLLAVGILPKSGSGGGWQGLGSSKDKRTIIEKLIEEKKLVEVIIEGSKYSYVSPASVADQLQAPVQPIANPKMTFIAPLDTLVWDRTMLEDFFNFTYRWEVYTPVTKRKFGYYVLPILYGDKFFGRIEPVLNKDKNLEIKGFWMEPSYVWGKREWQALEIALEEFKDYLKAGSIVNAPKQP